MIKITECGVDYEIDYSNDNVRNVLLRHIERLEDRLAIERYVSISSPSKERDACANVCAAMDEIHGLRRWQNEAAGVMARFINLSDHPDSESRGEVAIAATRLMSAPIVHVRGRPLLGDPSSTPG